MSTKLDDELNNSPPNANSRNFYKFCIFHLIISLSVFILPGNILSRCEVYLNFVNFMKTALPAVEVFSSVSKLPEITAFYTSYMCILAIIWAILVGVTLFFAKSDESTEDTGIFASVFMLVLGLFGLHLAHIGDIAISGIKDRHGSVMYLAKLGSRTEILFDVNVYLILALFGYIFMIFSLSSLLKALISHVKEAKEINK